jgi:hypothetical protein
MSHRSISQRGSALIIVVVILAVLMVAAATVIGYGLSEGSAVAGKRRHDSAVSCADAAREYLLSQFRVYGMAPTQLTMNTTVGTQRMATGHYDNMAITSVQGASGLSGGGVSGAMDISNRVAKAGLGGQYYRMTVVCSDATASNSLDGGNQQSEVEFVVKFGL